MNPGKYRDLVVLQEVSVVVGDDYGQTPTYTDGESFWANIMLNGGFEVLDGMVLQGETQFRIRCEWNPIAAAIRTNQRLKVSTRDDLLLNVTTTAEDADGRRKRIEFLCERLEHDQE